MIEKLNQHNRILYNDLGGDLVSDNLQGCSPSDLLNIPVYKVPVKGEINYSLTSFSNQFMTGVKNYFSKNKIKVAKDINIITLNNYFIGFNDLKFTPYFAKDFDIEISKVFNFNSFIKGFKELREISLNINYVEKLLYDMDLEVNKGIKSAVDYLFKRYKLLTTINIETLTIVRDSWTNNEVDKDKVEVLNEQLYQLEWTRTLKWAIKKHSPSKIFTRRSCYEMWSSNIRKKGNYGLYSGYIKGYGKLQKDKTFISIIIDFIKSIFKF